MESNKNQKNSIMSKEQKIRFWAIWILAILCLLASIFASIATAILHYL